MPLSPSPLSASTITYHVFQHITPTIDASHDDTATPSACSHCPARRHRRNQLCCACPAFATTIIRSQLSARSCTSSSRPSIATIPPSSATPSTCSCSTISYRPPTCTTSSHYLASRCPTTFSSAPCPTTATLRPARTNTSTCAPSFHPTCSRATSRINACPSSFISHPFSPHYHAPT